MSDPGAPTMPVDYLYLYRGIVTRVVDGELITASMFDDVADRRIRDSVGRCERLHSDASERIGIANGDLVFWRKCAMFQTMTRFAQRHTIVYRYHVRVLDQMMSKVETLLRTFKGQWPLTSPQLNNAGKRDYMMSAEVATTGITALLARERVTSKDSRTPMLGAPAAHRGHHISDTLPVWVVLSLGVYPIARSAQASLITPLALATLRTSQGFLLLSALPISVIYPCVVPKPFSFYRGSGRDFVNVHPSRNCPEAALAFSGNVTQRYLSILISKAKPLSHFIRSIPSADRTIAFGKLCASRIIGILPTNCIFVRRATTMRTELPVPTINVRFQSEKRLAALLAKTFDGGRIAAHRLVLSTGVMPGAVYRSAPVFR